MAGRNGGLGQTWACWSLFSHAKKTQGVAVIAGGNLTEFKRWSSFAAMLLAGVILSYTGTVG